MTDSERLAQLRYDGIQWLESRGRAEALAQVTDAESGSTFYLQPGETISDALARFVRRWQDEERQP